MLNKSTIRTDEQLRADGFSIIDIKSFRRNESRYYVSLVELDTANAEKDWDAVLDLEAHVASLEFLLKYQGKNPKEIPVKDLKAQIHDRPIEDSNTKASFKRIRNQGTGIRAFCITCMGGQPVEVRLCPATHCPLWPFRLGNNPFFGKTLMPVADIEVEGDEKIEVEDDPDDGASDE
jgi:hypothetical protein